VYPWKKAPIPMNGNVSEKAAVVVKRITVDASAVVDGTACDQ
jgi:hypothetical protein